MRTGLTGRDLWRRHLWVIPALLGGLAIAYLAWGAWICAHDQQWPYVSQVWWRVLLRPDDDWLLLATIALCAAGLLGYWWPRRLAQLPIALITVVTMVLIGTVLATSSLVPCRGQLSNSVVVAWILALFAGNQPPAYGPAAACTGQQPLALQLGQVACLGATVIGAVAVAAALWREPVGRLRSRFTREVTVFTGLDTMTIPLLRRLALEEGPRNVIVIEPDIGNPLIDEARGCGVRVIIGDPAARRMLSPIISGWRGPKLSYLYALSHHVPDNEVVLKTAGDILRQSRADPDRQPHLVARIDDPRHAVYWRGRHSGTSESWFEDALSCEEVTARSLVRRVQRMGTRQLFLCGDSTLALAVLLEFAQSAWERHELMKAADAGRDAIIGQRAAANGDAADEDEADLEMLDLETPAQLPLERIVLLDSRAADLHREYLATAPKPVVEALPILDTQSEPWNTQLLSTLDRMHPREALESAVLVVDSLSESSLHEAGRVARLHAGTPVFVLIAKGKTANTTIFDQLHPFQRALLVDGAVPEDTWARVARHWHECHRLAHPVAPGDPRTRTRLPWEDLDPDTRQDNVLQLRSILAEVARRGRQWAPVRSAAEGSYVELTDHDLEEVAAAEHNRWYERRRAAGWSAANGARVNPSAVPWAELPSGKRAEQVESVRSQVARLEDVGFVPILPRGGPPGAARFERIGVIRARRLRGRRIWVRRPGDELAGDTGDWRVIDSSGSERTVRDQEFRASHEPLGHELWRRVGTFSAWQVGETVVIRTKEGRATAQPGDWVVEGSHGERWPVAADQFLRTYRAVDDE
jgi:hypothetical protein